MQPRRRVAQPSHLVLVGCVAVPLLIYAVMRSRLSQPYMLNMSPFLDHFEPLIQFWSNGHHLVVMFERF
ncbi:hypothetical protein TorRG33x02_356940 [Trema orientale]|uniref:Uncharacterized protein n=1 Tax=Trema orientale TaxID=63057 RepID=A0A2P5A652_TREOI|nr:hypothetical protein TorRG33x02_356940 [Trema orientale]